MSNGISDADYAAYRLADAEDRRAAAQIAASASDGFTSWQDRADAVYAWLRARDTVRPHTLAITAGEPAPQKQGETP